jgi:hypothetical protein
MRSLAEWPQLSIRFRLSKIEGLVWLHYFLAHPELICVFVKERVGRGRARESECAQVIELIQNSERVLYKSAAKHCRE